MFFRSLAEKLVLSLPVNMPNLFNPWREHCQRETVSNGPDARLDRLVMHLTCDPEFILVGEAPGYQGCRYSGIAFTSERLLLEGHIPRVPVPSGRLSDRKSPFSEPSATIVWKTILDLEIAERTILWNALQLHPHMADNIWSNRTPKVHEMVLGKTSMNLICKAFPHARIVAVGKKSAGLLNSMGVDAKLTVRHPANGGAKEFAQGLSKLR